MRLLGLISLAVLAATLPARADDVSLLFKKYKCTQCHATDHRPQQAPSYDEIMKKYKGKNAGADLAAVIKNGSNETWGMTHMNGNPTIPDADIELMVAWILKH